MNSNEPFWRPARSSVPPKTSASGTAQRSRAQQSKPAEPHRHTVTKPSQSPHNKTHYNRSSFNPMSSLKPPLWMQMRDDDAFSIHLSPATKQILIIVGMIAGFFLVAMQRSISYYVMYGIAVIVGTVIFFRMNRYMLLRGFTLIIALCALVGSWQGITDVRMENEAYRLEQEAIARERAEKEAEARARCAAQTPTPQEIEWGGVTHDGIPLKMVLYYSGVTSYHTDPDCSAVNEKYLPMTTWILYEQLTESKYSYMQPCSACRAPVRPHTH